jgi:hypothetical protein
MQFSNPAYFVLLLSRTDQILLYGALEVLVLGVNTLQLRFEVANLIFVKFVSLCGLL